MNKDLYNLILNRRTVRFFTQEKVPREILEKAVNAARLAPSARNAQFLEYLVIDNPQLCAKISGMVKMGGYVFPKRMPDKERQPTAYIVLLGNKEKSPDTDTRDVGAAAENILLSLCAFDLGGCWIASVDKNGLREQFSIPDIYEIDSVIACGVPAEKPIVEEKDEVKYWLDEQDVLHVPKRPLEKIIYYNSLSKKEVI
ncbi:MAG: nitroreductase family protein [Candidatus Omnitrophica bacterium]|nr:nitroreductase family protein [Candidatus Omnitrophota bacterium]